ncbi:cell division protein ZapE [Permianibacter sp. IMCC34836]|uniref:cell division protein ZapE n=1 Tax=Permianibacter fluminis TaxID=2738515 RepID=UPI0015545010|nr:cell division protein ZapE [Permianibacter fluminis]NQD37852.1 cell division protein ZapE [Permianibacter fluminis]
MPTASPLTAYQHALAVDGFVADSAQWRAVQQLQQCHEQLLSSDRAQPVSGVYLWGPVGRGKTWLMDQFYRCLLAHSSVPVKRLHFHHFMRWVHQRLFALSGTAAPLQALARELRAETRVLCFDELFVSDIGDAMILGGLLQALFDQGLVVVATSNQAPQQLYAEGFNRERLLPAIAAIERHMQIVSVDGEQDHRLHPGLMRQRYWLSGEGSGMAEAFAAFATAESVALPGERDERNSDLVLAHPPAFELGHLPIPVVRRNAKAIWFRFHDLCEQPLAALDFITLCDQFAAIFVSDVPNLSAQQRPGRIARGTEDAAERVAAGDRQLPALSIHDDSVRRFIALVDECYDRQIPLYVEAAVPMEVLYTEGYLSFPFRRTLSRLKEMQLQRFGAARRR